MDIRNIAIIAHVDHGKTTLVDWMLKTTHTFRDNEAHMFEDLIMDSGDLEREKGITILAKNTSVFYRNTKINIIDTPGHADFGGEVERVISMADGALLIVDSAEGPLPQTQFVLEQALSHHLKLIVLINKIDRKDARPLEVLHQTEELFLRLAKHEDHLSFPVLFSVGREGKVWSEMPDNFTGPGSLEPLFRTIINFIPAPGGNPDKPFKMQISSLDFDPHKGTLAIGKVSRGSVTKGQRVLLMDEMSKIGQYSVEEVFTTQGLNRISTEHGITGDIIALTGLGDAAIGNTVTDPSDSSGFPAIILEEPTLQIVLSVNTSPLAGKEGTYSGARQIHGRLLREKKTNIGLRIKERDNGTGFIVSGRGELHLAVLLEILRREGFEMQVGKPEVIYKTVNGVLCEPYEEITIEIDSSFIGVITEELGTRRAELIDMHTDDRGLTRIIYRLSSRNLLGFRGQILTKTRGNGIFSTRFAGYLPLSGDLPKIRNGVLVSFETGKASAYALTTVQERGKSFISPGTRVYEGMIIGINNRQEDIDINVCKSKKLTNIHSANADIAIQLDPPVVMSLEQCLDFIESDELLEITPISLRLRKINLSKTDRIRAKRTSLSSQSEI